MGSPIDGLIETLTETRARLDEELGRTEAYRALCQLEHREASGERLAIVPADRLRAMLKAELDSNSCFRSLSKIDEALAKLGAWPATSAPAGPEPASLAARGSNAADQASTELALPAVAAEGGLGSSEAPRGADDLTLVRDLPVTCISVVTAAGYGRYAALAAIDSAGVKLLERLLGQPGLVSRGNWIEQASVLALGRETRYAARVRALRTGAEWPPQGAVPDVLQAIAGAEPVSQVIALEPKPLARDDLTHLAGVDQGLADRLAADGVTFQRIAAWTAADRDRAAAAIGTAPARIAEQGWIEQAALLAAGRVSHYLEGKPRAVPLAALPAPLAIPLDEDLRPAAEAPAESELEPPPDPLLMPAAANDDPPPPEDAEAPETPPPAIWPAAAAKAAILRPLRKPADRGDKAFDDVAALVARTVATARNVGGMSERATRPQSQPSAKHAPQTATPHPSLPSVPAALAVTNVPPVASKPLSRPDPPAPNARSAGEGEASIEIRPRAQATAPRPAAAPLPTANGTSAPGRIAGRLPAAPAAAKPLVATTRLAKTSPQPATAAPQPVRRLVVIDELNRSVPSAATVVAANAASNGVALKTGGLFNRLVRALKGNSAD